ncbi:MAG: adaptor protein MecA [Clostridia bacterium]|nr:adaptor protein MecA [Clostridia bacterium]
MEWIRISDNKLKIMLTAQDAARYDLHCESADYAEAPTREAFREILAAVRDESGFDTTEEKLYIQMYPSKEGGCELFVTKMGLLITEPRTGEIPDGEPSTPVKKPRRSSLLRKRCTAFSFEALPELLSLCRRLNGQGYIGESEIWKENEGAWWLLLTENASPLTARDDLRFIREYARMYSGADARIFLSEHGRCICDAGAVETFARL